MKPPDQPALRLLEILRGSKVFGQLAEPVLLDLAAALNLLSFEGGHQLLKEGEVADSMIIVISGRLRVSRQDPVAGLRLYNEICPGETVGETGLLLQQRRFADVTAVRDSTVAFLYCGAFEQLLQRHPLALNRVFAQALYHQLRHTPQIAEQRRAQTFALIPLNAGVATEEASEALVGALQGFGKALRVPMIQQAPENFDALERQFDYLICEGAAADSAETRRAFRQADQVIFVANAGDSTELSAVELGLADEAGFAMKRKHLLLVHPVEGSMPDLPQPWLGPRDVERLYPVRSGRDRDFARLARFLTSRAVGVVLGGGGARGFSHLGVLRAFEELGVPVDLIGGNSMGALIGAQYANGVSLDEILERTRRFAMGGERPTLPLISLLSGQRIARDLRRMFGEQRIEQLWRPFFAAACNLSRVETTVLDSGPLWRAVLASNSPAGLLPPVVHQGDLLVDGAILDNVPISPMRARLGTPLEQRRGNGTVIAVDVDVGGALGVAPEVQHLSVMKTLKSYFSDDQQSPSIGAILYRAGHIGGLHQRSRTKALADHYLAPPVTEFPIMAYRRAEEIVEIGYRHALQQIGEWPGLPGQA